MEHKGTLLRDVSLAFAWSASPLAALPWFPARIQIHFGPPLTAETLFETAHPTHPVRRTTSRRRSSRYLFREGGAQGRLARSEGAGAQGQESERLSVNGR
jgi:hypothetical protein